MCSVLTLLTRLQLCVRLGFGLGLLFAVVVLALLAFSLAYSTASFRSDLFRGQFGLLFVLCWSKNKPGTRLRNLIRLLVEILDFCKRTLATRRQTASASFSFVYPCSGYIDF